MVNMACPTLSWLYSGHLPFCCIFFLEEKKKVLNGWERGEHPEIYLFPNQSFNCNFWLQPQVRSHFQMYLYNNCWALLLFGDIANLGTTICVNFQLFACLSHLPCVPLLSELLASCVHHLIFHWFSFEFLQCYILFSGISEEAEVEHMEISSLPYLIKRVSFNSYQSLFRNTSFLYFYLFFISMIQFYRTNS